jgi:hypothetical protein
VKTAKPVRAEGRYKMERPMNLQLKSAEIKLIRAIANREEDGYFDPVSGHTGEEIEDFLRNNGGDHILRRNGLEV